MVGDLADLAGPADGVVELPVVLDWSPKRRYDLGDPDDRRRLYAGVITEAMRAEHLRDYLNRDVLLDVWPKLILPRHVAERWETAFPELAARGGSGGEQP